MDPFIQIKWNNVGLRVETLPSLTHRGVCMTWRRTKVAGHGVHCRERLRFPGFTAFDACYSVKTYTEAACGVHSHQRPGLARSVYPTHTHTSKPLAYLPVRPHIHSTTVTTWKYSLTQTRAEASVNNQAAAATNAHTHTHISSILTLCMCTKNAAT